ncbi:unnamed protein product, partial [Gulo gulo]
SVPPHRTPSSASAPAVGWWPQRSPGEAAVGAEGSGWAWAAGTRGALPISWAGKNLSFSFTKSFFFWLRIAYFSPFRLKFFVP